MSPFCWMKFLFWWVLGRGEADLFEDDAGGVESEDPFGSPALWNGNFLVNFLDISLVFDHLPLICLVVAVE